MYNKAAKKEYIKLYAAWEITPLCSFNCDHCYRLSMDEDYITPSMGKMPENNEAVIRILSFEKIQKGLDNLFAIGVRNFNIEGGEPTLRDDLVEIAEYARKIGMDKIILSSNCYGLLDLDQNGIALVEKIKDKVDYISVSLDSANKQEHDRIRNGLGYDKVIYFIKWYANEWRKSQETGEKLFKLKINTTAQKANIESVFEIPGFLSNFLTSEMGASLRLGKVQIRGKASKNKEHIDINQQEFYKAIKLFSESAQKHGFAIRERNDEMHISSEKLPYLLVDFFGGLAIPDAKNNVHRKIIFNGKQLNIFEKEFLDYYREIEDKNWERMTEANNTYDNLAVCN